MTLLHPPTGYTPLGEVLRWRGLIEVRCHPAVTETRTPRGRVTRQARPAHVVVDRRLPLVPTTADPAALDDAAAAIREAAAWLRSQHNAPTPDQLSLLDTKEDAC